MPINDHYLLYDNNEYLFNTYDLPVTVLNILHILAHLILTVTLRGTCCYVHFTDEKTEVERERQKNLPKVTELVMAELEL